MVGLRRLKSLRSIEEALKPFGLAMKRLSGLGSEMVRLRSVFRIRPPGNGVGGKPETGDGDALRPRYHIEEEDLQEIHKAAFRGNVPEVQRLLSLYPELLNDKDWRNR